MTDESPQSKGGIARRESLSPEARKEIAERAALARWKRVETADPARIPEVEYQGLLKIGDVEIECYNLDDNRRVIGKRGIAKGLGLKSAGGNAFIKTMSGRGIGSAIDEKLRETINNPILFKPFTGDLGHGYEATLLIEVCDAIIQARNDGRLTTQQVDLAKQAEIIVRAAAKIGIIALVDEATGYIADKRKEEYRQLFQAFIQDEFRQWQKEFPNQFFDMLYRLYGLKRKHPNSFKHPRFFGKFIRKYVFYPLANSRGAILEGLEERNPVVYVNGGRRYKMFQFLTDQVGLPALRQHLWQVVGIGNSVGDKAAFDRAFARAFAQPNVQMDLFE